MSGILNNKSNIVCFGEVESCNNVGCVRNVDGIDGVVSKFARSIYRGKRVTRLVLECRIDDLGWMRFTVQFGLGKALILLNLRRLTRSERGPSRPSESDTPSHLDYDMAESDRHWLGEPSL